MIKLFYVIISLILLISCSKETIYSGKILNQDNFDNFNFKTKNSLIEKLDNPSFIDPIDKKFFYYSEKKERKSIFKEDLQYSYIFVFEFDENDLIINSKAYDLNNVTNIEIIKDETNNEVVRRGLIERIFGGVGPQSDLPNSQ